MSLPPLLWMAAVRPRAVRSSVTKPDLPVEAARTTPVPSVIRPSSGCITAGC